MTRKTENIWELLEDLSKTKPDMCFTFYASRQQRETEIERGEGTKGTKGYEITGCYNCDGLNTSCPKYTPLKNIYD